MRNTKISLFILTILMGFMLVSCKKTKTPKAEIDELKITRNSFTLVFTIEDEDNVLNTKSLEGKLTYKKTTHINTYEAKEVEDTTNTYEISGANLSIDHEYTIKVTGVANKKIVTLINKTFKTKKEGSSSENPIYIETVDDFLNIEDDYNAYYKLVNDLDFGDIEDFTPPFLTRAFSGNLDGGGKTFKNININTRHTYTALIGRNAGTIKNLTIENMHINLSGTGQSSQYISLLTGRNTGTIENVTVVNSSIKTYFSHSGLVRIGGLSAYSESGSKINDSDVNVTFTIDSISRTEYNIGGLAGELNGGSTSGNKVKTNIEISNTTTAYIGGAIGKMDESTVNISTAKESEAELDININTNVKTVLASNKTVAISIGGFVGKAISAKITDAYAKANIVYPEVYNAASSQSSSDKVALGGFAGSVSNRSELKNILSDSEISLGSVYEYVELERLNVKFDLAYNEERLPAKEIMKGEAISAPEDPVREGYTFEGWYLGNELYDFTKPVNNTINLVAQWEKINSNEEEKLVVIFDRGYSGLYYKEVKVKKGEIVDLPKDPTRDGYKFIGWYLDGELFDFEDPINYSLGLQARWIKIGIDRIELIYVGGIAGESFASTHENNYARNPEIVLFTDEGKYLISPTVGSNYLLGSYSGGSISVNEVDYNNQNYHLEDGEIETTSVPETEIDDFFDSEYILEILNR